MIKYNSDEYKMIFNAYDKALDDIEEIYALSEEEEIDVAIFYKDIDEFTDERLKMYHFVVKPTGIFVEYRASYPKEVIPLQTINKKNKKIRGYNIEQAELILQEYESIRTGVKKAVEKSIKDKKEKLDLFRNIDNKYTKDVTIEFDLPQTNNQHTIDLRHEDGKTIGEIKLGQGTMRIITSGPITIKKAEEPKPKMKLFGEKLWR